MAPGTLLRAVVGSTAYGLAHAGSDVDRLGVYLAATADVLGLDGPRLVEASVVTADPDVTLHELGKFARLALAVNPTITELLWVDAYEVCTPDGQQLVDLRAAFLSESRVRDAYAGYAVSQVQRIVDRAGDSQPARLAKHARHCGRLLLQAEELLSTGQLSLDVSAHRDELFALGDLATRDLTAFQDWFERRMAFLAEVPSVLPREPDRDAVESLVRSIRRNALS